MSQRAVEALDSVGKLVFANKDPLMQDLIATEAARIRDAMRLLGLEWNGTFNESHIMTVAYAYNAMMEGKA